MRNVWPLLLVSICIAFHCRQLTKHYEWLCNCTNMLNAFQRCRFSYESVSSVSLKNNNNNFGLYFEMSVILRHQLLTAWLLLLFLVRVLNATAVSSWNMILNCFFWIIDAHKWVGKSKIINVNVSIDFMKTHIFIQIVEKKTTSADSMYLLLPYRIQVHLLGVCCLHENDIDNNVTSYIWINKTTIPNYTFSTQKHSQIGCQVSKLIWDFWHSHMQLKFNTHKKRPIDDECKWWMMSMLNHHNMLNAIHEIYFYRIQYNVCSEDSK